MTKLSKSAKKTKYPEVRTDAVETAEDALNGMIDDFGHDKKLVCGVAKNRL
ncbi:hypothetical protein [Pseudogulbenkiania subflava]|uniref:hypothetical protein n=1 Tax=Pseudogulbenkiania subflava TaxID=451637 RepID=UPI00135646DB|nr:hypothetical protein [Pseudogulbenkiania subflava]